MTKLKNKSGFKKRFSVISGKITFSKGKNHFRRNHSKHTKADYGRRVIVQDCHVKLFKKQIPLKYLAG